MCLIILNPEQCQEEIVFFLKKMIKKNKAVENPVAQEVETKAYIPFPN